MARFAAVLVAALLACVGAASAQAAPLDGDGMWIWQLDKAAGGDPNAIADKAIANGVEVVVIKAAAGPVPWTQVNPYVVDTLKQRGLKVCGYQYVFGAKPVAEARVAAGIVATGVDCLMIDAETEYEGKYAQAQKYLKTLRARIGPDYPVGLTTFPYVHFHPAFPYSVFLGPGGAQFNVPQMYWHSIGTSVDMNYATTYRYNRPYGRPIYPLGQVAFSPPPAQIKRFRRIGTAYGAPGVSWWSWQHAINRDWRAVGVLVPALVGFITPTDQPVLGRGAKGDIVVWAQQHLRTAGSTLAIDGVYGSTTVAAVRDFQRANGLGATGVLDAATWPKLLALGPTTITWRTRKGRAYAAGAGDRRNGPRSAFLPARADELRGLHIR